MSKAKAMKRLLSKSRRRIRILPTFEKLAR